MKTPITKERIRQHLTYSWWKYLLLAVAAVMGWSLFFTMTAPQTPENEKLDVYLYAHGNRDPLDAYLLRLHNEDFPELKELNIQWITPDDSQGLLVLSTHMMAGEGDLLLLPRTEFNNYAGIGLYQPLEELPGVLEACERAGINLERAWRKNSDTGERHLYGIPVGQMDVLNRSISNVNDYYLGIRVNNGNQEAANQLLLAFLRDLLPAVQE